MAKKKNLSTFGKRDALAKKQGFKSYGEKRKILKYAKDSDDFADVTNRDTDEIRGDDPEVRQQAKLFWDAFKENPDDYSPTGPKARWFVEVEGLMSYDEWKEHYPRGVREYRSTHFAA